MPPVRGGDNMDKVSWIKDLVRAEQQMEETGIVDMSAGFDLESQLMQESTYFLNQLKMDFADSAAAFNDLKSSTIGRIKIYGIAKTHADFMLFRNGYKLIFSLKKPGVISVRFNYINNTPMSPLQNDGAGAMALIEEDLLESRWGAFGDLVWTFKGENIKIISVVRYYMTRFIRESAK